MLRVNHSGNMGDILYSLYFLKEFSERVNVAGDIEFIIQTSVAAEYKCLNHPYGSIRMTQNAAEFVKPLLEKVPFIKKVTISSELPTERKYS